MVRTLLSAFLLLFISTSSAQEFPSRTVTVVVPFPAGSISDVISRIAADRMAKAMAQPVVVENRPGLNGSVGAAQVTRAAPDGYTMLLGTNGIMFINPLLFRNLPYDPKDLAPLALAAGRALNRCEYLRLLAGGIGTPEAVRDADDQPIEQVLGSSTRVRQLRQDVEAYLNGETDKAMFAALIAEVDASA